MEFIYGPTNAEHHHFSPSRLDRIMHCPGSYALEAQVPPPEEEPDKAAADEGKMLHDHILPLTKPLADLTVEQNAAVDKCREEFLFLARTAQTCYVERSLKWLSGSFAVVTEGTPDVVLVEDNKLTVIDWKFGRGDVPAAADNWQLIAYAYMAWVTYAKRSPDFTVTGIIYQPRVDHGESPFNRHEWFGPALQSLANDVEAAVSTALDKDDMHLHVGHGCRYCSAKAHCPLLFAQVGRVQAPSRITDTAQLIESYEAWHLVEPLGELLDSAAKRAAGKGALPGYRLAERAAARSVSDLTELYRRLVGEGRTLASAEDFLSYCKFGGIGEWENAWVAMYQQQHEGATRKEALAQLNELIGDLYTRGAPTQTLKRAKE